MLTIIDIYVYFKNKFKMLTIVFNHLYTRLSTSLINLHSYRAFLRNILYFLDRIPISLIFLLCLQQFIK